MAVTTTVRVDDPEINRKAKKILSAMGMTASGAYNMLMHQIVNSNGLPFRPHEQTADEEYRQLLEDRREADDMIAHGSLTYYPDGEAMVKDILS